MSGVFPDNNFLSPQINDTAFRQVIKRAVQKNALPSFMVKLLRSWDDQIIIQGIKRGLSTHSYISITTLTACFL